MHRLHDPVRRGRFQLLDPVAKFLPAFGKLRVLRGNSASDTQVDLLRPITIRDLLTHTAGLAYGLVNETAVDELYRQAHLVDDGARTLEAMIDELVRLPLAYQPGAIWYYSVSIDVIGHLIEVISGRPLQDFLRERLFKPLGMTDTAFHIPPGTRPTILPSISYRKMFPASLPTRALRLTKRILWTTPPSPAAGLGCSPLPGITCASPRCCCSAASWTGAHFSAQDHRPDAPQPPGPGSAALRGRRHADERIWVWVGLA